MRLYLLITYLLNYVNVFTLTQSSVLFNGNLYVKCKFVFMSDVVFLSDFILCAWPQHIL